MKKIYFLYCAILGIQMVNAQNPIPNPTFATAWSNGKPNGWTDSRDVNQVSPGSDDNYAAEGLKSANTYPAYITSSGGSGIPVSQQYNYLNLSYKFNSVSSDVLYISVTMRNAGHSGVGSGVWTVNTSVTSFSFLSVPIYYSGSSPTECIISVIMNSSGGGVPTVGSYFVIDNLSLTANPVSSIAENEQYSVNFSVTPNPAKNWIEVEMNRPNTPVTLRLFDLTGQLIRTVPATEQKTLLDINDLAGGMYLLAVEQNGAVTTKKIIISR